MTIRNLDALTSPRSVALVGASEREGSLGRVVYGRLLAAGFRGEVFAVNPRRSSVLGRPCVPSLSDLAQPPDLAVVVTPAPVVPQIIAEAAEAGTRAAIVITAGLDEATKTAMLNAARPALLRVLGPNCLGLQVPPIGLDASFAHAMARPGNLALLSQSGAIATAMIDWAEALGIGFP